MLKPTFLAISLFLSTSPTYQDNVSVWESAYIGDFATAQRQILLKHEKDIENQLMNFMIMAYAFYRVGDCDGILDMFQGVDQLIEKELMFPTIVK